MTDESEDVFKYWTTHMFAWWSGKRWLVDHDHKIPKMLVQIDGLMYEIAKSEGDQFWVVTTLRTVEVGKSAVGQKLYDCIKYVDFELISRHLSKHKFSPYFYLLKKHCDRARWLVDALETRSGVVAANEWLSTVRSEARADGYMRQMENHRRGAIKNWHGLKLFIDGLFRRHSKVLVVRVDLGYRCDPSEGGVTRLVSAKDFKLHLRKMLRHLREKVPHLKGVVWKLEYGAMKGYHAHAMLFFDGHQVREGITWGKFVGEAWRGIAGSEATYWNANANEDAYRRRGLLGIGMIHFADKALREGLERSAMYLTKVDMYARLMCPCIGRTFGRTLLKPRNNRGRPRNAG